MILVNGKEIESFTFPGGEVQIRAFGKDVKVTAFLRNSDDIMKLLLLGNAVTISELTIPYMPYARQDRVCAPGEAFSISVMADLINGLGADKVICWDVHSKVTEELIHNLENIEQSRFIEWDLDLSRIMRDKDYSICCPDAGAIDKIHKLQKVFDIDPVRIIYGNKVRDILGNITETNITGLTSKKKVLIVDDICDGGRTFIELAKALKTWGAESVNLYVTHGIFSKGFDVFDGLIDTIWTTDSYCTQTHHKLNQVKGTTCTTYDQQQQ